MNDGRSDRLKQSLPINRLRKLLKKRKIYLGYMVWPILIDLIQLIFHENKSDL